MSGDSSTADLMNAAVKQQSAIDEKAKRIPPLYRNWYLKAMEGNSRKNAITAMCLDCTSWNRIEVERCSSLACPLYMYRPYKPEEEQ